MILVGHPAPGVGKPSLNEARSDADITCRMCICKVSLTHGARSAKLIGPNADQEGPMKIIKTIAEDPCGAAPDCPEFLETDDGGGIARGYKVS